MALQLIQPMVAMIEPCDLGILALDRLMVSGYCKRIASPDDITKKTQRKVDLQAAGNAKFSLPRCRSQNHEWDMNQPRWEIEPTPKAL